MRTAIWVSWALSATAAFPQSPAPPSFEAATIKPNASGGGSSGWDSHPGSIFLSNQTLKASICIAYHVQPDQVSGGPGWLDSDHFDINAKAAGPANDDQLLAMLRTLLAERFQLALHHEEKVRSAYALVAVKGGMKIHPLDPGEGSSTKGSKGRIEAQRASMAKLAERLSRLLGAPVADQTGATGVYTFTLEWAPEADATNSELFGALQERLGLKLEARKVAADLLVIDRAEKPSEN